jgi:hypothetical protein
MMAGEKKWQVGGSGAAVFPPTQAFTSLPKKEKQTGTWGLALWD